MRLIFSAIATIAKRITTIMIKVVNKIENNRLKSICDIDIAMQALHAK